ncbi:insulinase family protein [Thorsellia anophelis]|uniref:Predicted Zn-dependent peptidase n=1 Tax=Thorsellia anophelis DSM 18579 TaxID=1123402 RepID=A0A1I0FYN7_9GAMM|nr:insulinase family protein [Thorsellia anophelis]SET63519.1 Predicted Zn-dependent peptidase [Thorsellia anophelis DSM 18579]
MSKVVLTDKIGAFFLKMLKQKATYRFFFTVVVSLLAFISAPLSAKPLNADPAWQTQKLENGFSWQLLQATHRPSDPIEIRFVLNTGSLTETLTEKGFLFSLFKAALLQENGLPLIQLNQFNASTQDNPQPVITIGHDATIITLRVPNNQPEALKSAIGLLGGLVKENSLSTELLNKSLDENAALLIAAKPQNSQDGFWLNRIKNSSLVGFDPVLAQPAVIELDKLDEYYQKWFTPDAMHLYIVGKVDARILADTINKSFGELTGTRLKPAPAAILQPLESGTMIFSQAGLEQAVLTLYWDASWNSVSASKDLEKSWLLELAREAIFTRINQKLSSKSNDKQKLSFECSVLFQRQLCGLNLSNSTSNLAPQFTKISAELHSLKETGIKEDEFKAFIELKNQELANLFATYAHTDLSKLIDNRIHSQQNGIVDISLEQYQQLRQNFLSTLTLDEINDAIEAFLSRPATLVIRQPSGEIEIDVEPMYQKYIELIHPSKISEQITTGESSVENKVDIQ